jgi:hypothetical protein
VVKLWLEHWNECMDVCMYSQRASQNLQVAFVAFLNYQIDFADHIT